MKYQDILVPELQHEAALAEKFLKRIPEDKLDWRPHKKSMSVIELANHLAEIPSWVTGTMELDEMDLDGYKAPDFKSVDSIIAALKNNTNQALASLKKPNEEFSKTWKMTNKDEVLLEMEKYEVLRKMVLNQMPHHRAQLGVYLRLLDVSVPATYGPSADEG